MSLKRKHQYLRLLFCMEIFTKERQNLRLQLLVGCFDSCPCPPTPNLPNILVIIFWNFTTFQYRFDLPPGNWNLTSSMKNFVWELPNKLLNDVRLNCQKSDGWKQSLAPSLPSTNETFAIAVEKYAKADMKVFQSCPILLNFLNLFQVFCPGLSEQTTFCL